MAGWPPQRLRSGGGCSHAMWITFHQVSQQCSSLSKTYAFVFNGGLLAPVADSRGFPTWAPATPLDIHQ
eukprot:13616347-Alexandrium_andersonii.AAC.1